MAKPPSASNLIHKKIGKDVPKGGYGHNSRPAVPFTGDNPDGSAIKTGHASMPGMKKNPRMAAAKSALVKR